MRFSSLKDLPTVRTFYAIITMTSVSIPGDERSRTAPGHGYPAHTLSFPEILFFDDEEPWKKAIGELAHPKSGYAKEFRALVMEPVEVESHVVVTRK